MDDSQQKDRKEIIQLFQQFNSKLENKDNTGLMSLFVQDDTLFSFGTAEHEVFEKWDGNFQGYGAIIDQLRSPSLKREFTILNLQIHNDIAWYAGVISIKVTSLTPDIQNSEFVFRSTGVVRKTKNGWRFQQRHVSAPQSGIEDGRTWPTVEGLEADIAKWIEQFNLNPNLNDKLKRSEFLKYLIKAQEIIKLGE
ncbi:MAG: nuclear transport factor 2 family protein [Candidatus Kariarchaeaceae archaeon]